MSKLAISQTPSAITVVDQESAKVYTITNTQPHWEKVLEAIKNEDNDDEILNLISIKSSIENFSPIGDITVVGNDVQYNGHPLHGLDVDHLLEAIHTGNKRQANALVAFLKNKQENPSYKAVNMMYKFRQDRGMPLTNDGYFLAYKGVDQNYWSRQGNKKTVILSGEVDDSGRILNSIGSFIEVDRKCVEDDPSKGCGEGLHVGSLEYASSWGEKVVIVKVHPGDVVSVPDTEDNKMRVCAYTVVGECEGKLPEHFDTSLDVDDSDCDNDYDGDDDYDEGYEDGNSDGWGDRDRKCQPGESATDEFRTQAYIDGYNEGYDDVLMKNSVESKETDDENLSDDKEYVKGYEEGSDDGWAESDRKWTRSDSTTVLATQPYIDGYNDGYDDSSSNREDNDENTDYDDGYEDGVKDGKAHSAREYHDGDTPGPFDASQQYIDGYNAGYRWARYGK